MRKQCEDCGETLDEWSRSDQCDMCAHLDYEDHEASCRDCNEPLGAEDDECGGLCCDCYEVRVENGEHLD